MANNYLFGGGDWSYEQLQSKRKIAEQLMKQGGTPRNVGEGLNALGKGIAAAILNKRISTREGELRDEAMTSWGDFFGNWGGDTFGGGTSAGDGYGGVTTTPDATTYETPDTTEAERMFGPNMSDIYDPQPAPASAEIAWGNIGEDMRPREDLNTALAQSVGSVLGPDWQIQPTSTYRPGDPRQHGQRNAMDFGIVNAKTGERLSWDDPRLKAVAVDAASRGVRGFGAGPNYMGGNTFHFDIRDGDIGVWSDDNGKTSQGGPGATMWRDDLVSAISARPASGNTRLARAGVDTSPQPVAGTETAVASNNPLMETARAIAREEGVPEDMFLNLIAAESSWNPNARSGAGAIGLTQLMPGTAEELGVNPNDPVENMRGGARYLKAQLDRFGSPELALAAYNAGPTRVAEAGGIPDITETQNYVTKVMGAGAPQAPASAPTPTGGAMPPANMQTLMKIAQFANNPMLPPGQRMVAQALMQRMAGQMFAPPQEPDYQMVPGVGVVDMNNPPPELMAGQYEQPTDPNYATLPNGQYIDKNNPGAGAQDIPNYQQEPADEYQRYVQEETDAGRTPLPRLEYEMAIAKAGNPSFGQSGFNIADALDIGKIFEEEQGRARDANQVLGIIQEGRQLMDDGMITGAGANAKIQVIKLAKALGIDVPQDAADNAQAFKATMGRAVGMIIKLFGAGTGLSDADRQYAEQIVGGDYTLNEEAISRILGIAEKLSRQQVDRYNNVIVPGLVNGDVSALLSLGPGGAQTQPQPEPEAAPQEEQSASPQGETAEAEAGPPPASFVNNETIKSTADTVGVTVEQYWSILPEEERAQWQK